jgi:hypothetical protein
MIRQKMAAANLNLRPLVDDVERTAYSREVESDMAVVEL